MGLLRLIVYGLLFYFCFKLVSSFLGLNTNESPKVDGKPKGKGPLDLDENDIEDADFEEID